MDFSKIKEEYANDGVTVLKGFLSEKEVDVLMDEVNFLVENMPEQKEISTYNKRAKDENFLKSGDRVTYFFETEAVNDKGDFVMDKSLGLRKIGYGLHYENKVFRSVIFDNRVKEILRNLDFKNPGVTGSMIIFKNPVIGSGIIPHQDATYTYTEPSRLIGFWIALEDATVENSCLLFLPGSHKNGIYNRYLRNPDKTSDELMIFQGSMPEVDKSEMVPVQVKKGDCVIFDGQVIHASEPNKSTKSRKAFSFHVTEQEGVKWFEDNWRTMPKGGFMSVYNN